jgi:hypothetical protein
MLWTLVVFLLCFMWMLVETDFLMVRLPCGKCKTEAQILMLTTIVNEIMALPERKLLPQFCERTLYDKSQTGFHRTQYNRSKQSLQQMTIGKATFRLNPTLSNLYELIREVEKVQSEKHKPHQVTMSFPVATLVEDVRIGSHTETNKWTDDAGKKHKFNNIVIDHKIVFHDCLCGKEWLEAHYKDEYPEPTIDLEVGDKEFHVNGNFKTGLIAGYMGKVKKSRQSKMIEV